jgi:hypothetical protein
LDFLGFPWILSSESRLFNALRGESVANFFARFLLCAERRRDGSPESRPVEVQDCSWGKLNLVSDFLQEMVVRPLPFGRLNINAGALGETEALLAAILHLADDHPALSQILEMSEG